MIYETAVAVKHAEDKQVSYTSWSLRKYNAEMEAREDKPVEECLNFDKVFSKGPVSFP